MENFWECADTTNFNFTIVAVPGCISDYDDDPSLHQNVKTFEDIMQEASKPKFQKYSEGWLIQNILESMEENAKFWEKLADL